MLLHLIADVLDLVHAAAGFLLLVTCAVIFGWIAHEALGGESR